MNGWFLVAAVVAAYDAWAVASGNPTLSKMHADACGEHPALIGMGTVYLVAHLWGKWPKKADPFMAFAWAISQAAVKTQGTLSARRA